MIKKENNLVTNEQLYDYCSGIGHQLSSLILREKEISNMRCYFHLQMSEFNFLDFISHRKLHSAEKNQALLKDMTLPEPDTHN